MSSKSSASLMNSFRKMWLLKLGHAYLNSFSGTTGKTFESEQGNDQQAYPCKDMPVQVFGGRWHSNVRLSSLPAQPAQRSSPRVPMPPRHRQSTGVEQSQSS